MGGQGSKVGHVIIWADGTVTGLRGQWKGAVELTVARRDAIEATEVPALVYTDLMPAPVVGDRVLMNVAALERGLGTGGYALVIAVLDAEGRVAAQPPQPSGHLVKARYLPLQAMVAGADEQGSAHHELLADADSIDGMPVVVADLHSALAPVLLAIENDRPGTRVVYVMSDQGALPLAFSRSVAELRASGLLAGTVTVGQAFGGDLEAVTLHSGLLAARLALDAELVVVSQGPGKSRNRHSLGILRRHCRRGHQRCRHPGRPSGRNLADLGRRFQGAAPRSLSSQPDCVRPGCALPGRYRSARSCERWLARHGQAGSRRCRWGASASPAPTDHGRPRWSQNCPCLVTDPAFEHGPRPRR